MASISIKSLTLWSLGCDVLHLILACYKTDLPKKTTAVQVKVLKPQPQPGITQLSGMVYQLACISVSLANNKN